jgi:hypothetical protein
MTTCTAAGDTECLFAKRSTSSPSVFAMSFNFPDATKWGLAASSSGLVRQTFEPRASKWLRYSLESADGRRLLD